MNTVCVYCIFDLYIDAGCFSLLLFSVFIYQINNFELFMSYAVLLVSLASSSFDFVKNPRNRETSIKVGKEKTKTCFDRIIVTWRLIGKYIIAKLGSKDQMTIAYRLPGRVWIQMLPKILYMFTLRLPNGFVIISNAAAVINHNGEAVADKYQVV